MKMCSNGYKNEFLCHKSRFLHSVKDSCSFVKANRNSSDDGPIYSTIAISVESKDMLQF